MVNGLIRGEIMAKSATAEIRSSEATGRGCRAAEEMAIDAPYEKPISVIEPLILMSTVEGDTVLDPMCGSGTTGVYLDDTPIQRAFRDVHAIANHAGNAFDVMAVPYAKHLLGLPQ